MATRIDWIQRGWPIRGCAIRGPNVRKTRRKKIRGRGTGINRASTDVFLAVFLPRNLGDVVRSSRGSGFAVLVFYPINLPCSLLKKELVKCSATFLESS
jgi:hypothetical protein